MLKKILLLTILFIVLVSIPITKVDATQVYVGVSVSNASAPGCISGTSNCGAYYSPGNPGYTSGYTPDTNWCLPASYTTSYGTQMAITTTASCSYFSSGNYDPSSVCPNNWCGSGYCLSATSPSTNPVSTTYPLCAGGATIWSGLLNLTNGTGYDAYLYTPNFCPGYINGNCWVKDATNEDCCNVCAHYGLTAAGGENSCETNSDCYNSYSNDDSNCSVEAALMGSPCSGGCSTNATYRSYNSTTKACETPYPSGSYYANCNATVTGEYRVCACNYANNNTGFLFPFTASW